VDLRAREADRMMLALRSPEGRIYLVVDDLGVDLALDEWDRSDSQLLSRDGVYDEWRAVSRAQLPELRRQARRSRRSRQQLMTGNLG